MIHGAPSCSPNDSTPHARLNVFLYLIFPLTEAVKTTVNRPDVGPSAIMQSSIMPSPSMSKEAEPMILSAGSDTEVPVS